ncbi:MAG: hypothetical protein R3B72_47335 [Polyangiaceae bacterium]
MFGWSFAARTHDEVARLVRAMGKHRYLADTDLRIHFTVDRALADFDEAHAAAARDFDRLADADPELDLRSRDPRLYRRVDDTVIARVLEAFWDPDDSAAERVQLALATALRVADLEPSEHAGFAGDADEPFHPELILLDWQFLPVDQLDTERHKGALRAMEESGDEVDPSEPVYVEGPEIGEAELCRGAERGVLPKDPIFWADGPYSYVDYVFRGVSKAAKLVDPPEGYHDVDKGSGSH